MEQVECFGARNFKADLQHTVEISWILSFIMSHAFHMHSFGPGWKL